MKHTSLAHDLLLFVVIPPIGTFAWWICSRGLTNAIGTTDDEAVKGWTASGVWIVLAVLSAICLAMLIYKYFFMA
jgi:hypothetical protein